MNVLRKIGRNLTLKKRIEERYILEKKILPKIKGKGKKILWVGCAEYTKDYPKMMKGNDVWTMDTDPKSAEYGSNKHIIDSVENIEKYSGKDFFDIVFMTGVFGYGLDDKREAENTMKNLYEVLKKKGILIVWWADRPGRNMVKPRELKNSELFEEISLIGYPSGYRTNKGVVLEFYRKD